MKSFRKSSLAVLLSLVGPAAFANGLGVAPQAPSVVPGARPGAVAAPQAPSVVPGARPGSQAPSSSSAGRTANPESQVSTARQALQGNPGSATQGAAVAAPRIAPSAPAQQAEANPVRNPVRRSGQVSDPVAARMQSAGLNRVRSYYGSAVADRVAGLSDSVRDIVILQLNSIEASPADEALEKRAGEAVTNIASKAGVSPFGEGLGLRECWTTFGKPAVTSALTTVASADDAVGANLDSSDASKARLDNAIKTGLGEATERTGAALDEAYDDLQNKGVCGIFKQKTTAGIN